MEYIPKDPFLEFNPNTLQDIRKQFNLNDPGAIAEVIDNFQDWIRKQNHFIKKDFDRYVLETMVITAKGSLERAKKSLDRICSAKTLRQDFFQNNNVNNFPDITKFIIPAPMPKMTEDFYRLYVTKLVKDDLDAKTFNYCFNFFMLGIEYHYSHDYCLGVECIVDCRGLNLLSLLAKIDIIEIKNLNTLIMEGYSLRLKAIHLLTESKSVEILVTVFKQILSTKLGGRIHVHRTVDSIHEKIPKDILPEEYGGKEKPLKTIYDDWFKILGSKECVEYFEDVCRPGTDEALRPADQYNEHDLGMPGSFRTLRVD